MGVRVGLGRRGLGSKGARGGGQAKMKEARGGRKRPQRAREGER